MRTSKAMIADLISDLEILADRPPAEVVTSLATWVANDGGPASIRTRVSEIRALAAAEAAGQLPEGAPIYDLAVMFQVSPNNAYRLVQLGRDLRAPKPEVTP